MVPRFCNISAITAREFGIDSKIRFGHRVCRVEWSSQSAEWIAEIERPALGERLQIRCRFLFMCTGYYRYDQGFTPDWRGRECFRGAVAHPQDWGAPKQGARRHSAIGDDLDYDGKRVVLIGSGATAVTMIPVLAQRARHVTMLQRSPTYVVSGPSRDDVSLWLQKHLPFGVASWLARWRLILRSLFYFQVARRRPQATRANMLAGIREALGPDFDVERHFAPRYNPWDQRVCLAPDGDFFKAIKAGAVSIATDEIERFVEDGILLKSGERLAADVIITATGLRMKIMHGVDIVVDGKTLALGETISYKGIMYSNIPNLASSLRLYKRFLDPKSRAHLRICLPLAELHGAARIQTMQTTLGWTRSRGQKPILISARVTCNGRWLACRSKGRAAPGECIRIT